MNNIYADAPDSLVSRLKTELRELQVEFGDDQSLEEMRLMTDTVIARVYNEPRKALEKESPCENLAESLEISILHVKTKMIENDYYTFRFDDVCSVEPLSCAKLHWQLRFV